MRENSWHLRLTSNEHRKWHQNIEELHYLTIGFARLLQKEDKIPPIESLDDDHLDDLFPQEFLSLLSQRVWKMQLEIISRHSGQVPLFMSTAFQLGSDCAKKRWPRLVQTKNQTLNTILKALFDSPFSGFPYNEHFLPRRVTTHEVQIELQHCPHQLPLKQDKNVRDHLCRLHGEWIKGYVQAMNPNIHFEISKPGLRCFQRWQLPYISH